jgi:hypothetical protein
MRIILRLLSSLALGLSLIFFISPFILYWFIHGSYERYIWIINGPYPFSLFGGGPFQLWMGILLIFSGIISLLLWLLFSYLERKTYKSSNL